MLPPFIDPAYAKIQSFPQDQESFIVKLSPNSSLVNAKNIEFTSVRSNECVLDLQNIYLSFEFRLVKSSGGNLDALDPKNYLSIINDAHSSLIAQLSISINNQVVEQTNHFNVLSHLINNLNHTADYRKSILRVAKYEEEAAGTVGQKTSSSFKENQKDVAESKVNYVINKINSPLLMQEKCLPVGCELTISITLPSNELFILTDLTDVKLEVLNSNLFIRYKRLGQATLNELKNSLNSKPYIIPYKKTNVRAISLQKGITTYTCHNLHLGKVPNKIICMMIETSKMLGDLAHSPYSYSHFNLKRYSFYLNNISLPTNEVVFDASKDDFIQLFHHNNIALNLISSGVTPSISLEKFKKEFFCLVQNFNVDVSTSPQNLLNQPGSVGLNLEWAVALPENVSLLVISEYSDSQIIIDYKENTVKLV